MKRLLAFILILCICITLTACISNEDLQGKAPETSDEETDVNSGDGSGGSSGIVTNEPNIGYYTFTGVVTGIGNVGGTIVVDVCDEYVSAVGAQVTVSTKDHTDLHPEVGDEVQITVDDKNKLKDEIIEAFEIVVISEMIAVPEKPVIYLYPEKDTVCSVRVDIDGTLTCTYPDHGDDGWQNFVARSDGTLVFPNGREYYCLYWEGVSNFTPDFSTGFCVKGSESAEFLEGILAEIGLTAREANEFIIYWLPRLEQNEYNLISFNTEKYCASACLEITPTPDSILRVFMAAKAVDSYVELEPESFDGFEREGFCVVEWGGCIVE